MIRAVPSTPLANAYDFRKAQIVNAIYAHPGLTRTELRKITGLNQTTIVRTVADLLERGVLALTDNKQSDGKRGRPSDVLSINPRVGYGLGIEFARDRLFVAITDALGDVVYWKQATDAPLFLSSDQTMDALVRIARQTAKEAAISWSDVHGIGLALHDIVSARGRWLTVEQVNEEPYGVREYLESRLVQQVTVEDVSRAFAEAEHRFGAGRHIPDMIYIFLGRRGVGGGIFVNNKILKSSSGVCGEIGHISVDDHGLLCHCGSQGCLETVASHQAVENEMRALIAQGVRSTLANNHEVTFDDICMAAGAGDKGAYLVLNRLAQNMSRALADAINITGAPVVIVGGGLSLAGEVFLAELASAIRPRVVNLLARHVSLRYAQLPAHAGAWGAAVQVLDKVWSAGVFLE